ncbi:MAG: TRAP transporter permease [Synergistaceae bacterium]|jgi:TRAP transporter 4TM/12TM fusion protein|nr:TRAP transporter permease [Synergistaceae bacterium]
MTEQEHIIQETSPEIDVEAIKRQYDSESRFRTPENWTKVLISVIAVVMSCFHLYTSAFGLLLEMWQRSIHLAFVLVLVFLLYPMTSKSTRKNVPWYDWILAGVSAFVTLYMVFQFHAMLSRAGMPNTLDLIVGFTGILIVLEATRRVSNPVLPVIAIFFLFYCYFGQYVPSIFQHRGYNFYRIINHMYLGTEGVFGAPLSVSATFVFMFVLFGTIVEQTGLGKYIIDLSMALAGWSAGGPAKVAVVSSGIMGMISGSSVANVCTTGMFTIPLMKSVGYESYFAGAVEAVASTGGQIMPPVMGAAAFIMAQTMGVPYIDVALAAIIPALLYYIAVLIQVHFEATRLGLKGLSRSQLPVLKKLILEHGYLLLPLLGIVYFLVSGYTPLKSAFYGILLTIVTSYARRDTWLTPKKLWAGLENGARSALGVACACATVGIVIGTATLTGLGLKLAHAIVTLAGGSKLLTLAFTMVASIILGMGLPTTANFIVTSTMAAPALIQMNVPPMAAYMFVLYFGIAADLTPPVALAAYAGAGIAKADPMKTGVTATKLALAGFLVPYIYAYSPILVLENFQGLEFAQAAVTALVGVFLLGMATIGFYRASLHWILRIIAFAGALGLMIPGWKSDFAGLVVLVVIGYVQTRKARGLPLF